MPLAMSPVTFEPQIYLPLMGMQILITLWIFVLGACFGSFLNVVIYRLPEGMSLGRPKSRCPQCETPLAARDNMPVIGWLLLKGKCRYCGLPISARYPLIETICGAIFVAMMFGELLTGAANLPLRHPDHFHINPNFWLVWFAKWDLLGLYLFHCCLLITVLAVGMIGYDRHPPVRRLRNFGLLTGLTAGMLSSVLRPVPALPYSTTFLNYRWGFELSKVIPNAAGAPWIGVSADGVMDGILGLIAGVLAARLITWQQKAGHHSTDAAQTNVAAVGDSLLLTGVFLGWQAVGMLLLIVIPILFLDNAISQLRHTSWLEKYAGPCFAFLLFAFLLLWQRLHESNWFIGVHGWNHSPLLWWQDWLATAGLLIVVAAASRRMKQNTDSHTDSNQTFEMS